MMAFDGKLRSERLFVILGMHRSGTSALCRCLLSMGVDLGSNLNPPHETNPKGFWEDLNILELNESLLATLGMRWDTFSLMSIERVQFIQQEELIEQARDIVRSKIRCSDNKIFGFKEPRTTSLLPFWQPCDRERDTFLETSSVYRREVTERAGGLGKKPCALSAASQSYLYPLNRA